MQLSARLSLALLLALSAYGCSCDNTNGPCPAGASSCGQLCESETPPLGCDAACDAATPCESGLYCSEAGTCTSDCASDGDAFCPDGACSSDGRCIDVSEICPDGSLSCGQACANGGAGDAGASACGQACDGSTLCPSGYYCGADQTCTADCFTLDDQYCPSGVCTTDGVCFDPRSGDGGTDGGNECASNVPVTTVTPNVIFLIDQSGSMWEEFDLSSVECGGGNCNNAGFPEESRWYDLRDALIGTGGGDTGLIGGLQADVRFALSLYEYSGGDNDPQCPTLTNIPDAVAAIDVELNNYSAISATYSTENPAGNTPTGDSVDALLADIPPSILNGSDPTIIILATDGEPDTCEDLNPQNGQQEAIDAVANAFNASGVLVFPLAVGGDVGDAHMMDIAVAGITGVARDTSMGSAPAANECDAGDLAAGTPCFYRPGAGTLRSSIDTLIQGQRSCTVDLDQGVSTWDTSCADGEVTLDLGPGPVPLICDDPNGFLMLNQNQFQLQGTACSSFLNTPGSVIDSSFPCGVIIIG